MASAFGKKINKRRLEKDLSLRDLANLTGLDHSYIARLEKGGPLPSRETVTKLSLALDISTDELMMAAGYLPDETKESSSQHGTVPAYTEAMTLYDEIEREVQAFQEKGIKLDRASAQKIVEHRRRILQGKEKCIEYIFEAKTLANALERLAELDFEFNFDDETMGKLVRKAREKYGLPEVKYSDPAAHGPNYPGSGIFDKNDGGEDEAE